MFFRENKQVFFLFKSCVDMPLQYNLNEENLLASKWCNSASYFGLLYVNMFLSICKWNMEVTPRRSYLHQLITVLIENVLLYPWTSVGCSQIIGTNNKLYGLTSGNRSRALIPVPIRYIATISELLLKILLFIESKQWTPSQCQYGERALHCHVKDRRTFYLLCSVCLLGEKERCESGGVGGEL